MDNVDLQVLRQVMQWREAGHRVVLATVTRTWGSAPRPIGSVVAVRGDGQIAGSVSGGCIEDDLIAKVKDGALALDKPGRVVYGVGAEEATRFGLPCGGTLELVLEPVTDASRIPELLELLREGGLVRRTLSLVDGSVLLEPAGNAEELRLNGSTLTTTHGPRWRLLLIGAGQMTYYLATMAKALDYEVIICDPRAEYADAWDVPGVRLLRGMPDDTVVELKPDGHTAVIALTHDPKLDDLALMEALNSPAFYVGAIGSRVNQAKRKARLAEHFGVTEPELARLHGPVGLKNGARTPPEIAISILAELTAERYGYAVPEPVLMKGDEKGPEGPDAWCDVRRR
ncbi:MAG TPA: XdhC family protein [Burkholderiaceae bacterium]|nr:XdhC family protein [Burkholderiaceae bacterium]